MIIGLCTAAVSTKVNSKKLEKQIKFHCTTSCCRNSEYPQQSFVNVIWTRWIVKMTICYFWISSSSNFSWVAFFWDGIAMVIEECAYIKNLSNKIQCLIKYTYIHTYTHTYAHTYIHTYICTYIRTYTSTYMHSYTHTHTHSRTLTHTCTHTHAHISTMLYCSSCIGL